jgi:hypothetical protein
LAARIACGERAAISRAVSCAAASGSEHTRVHFGSDLTSYRTTFGELQELIAMVVSRVAGMVR